MDFFEQEQEEVDSDGNPLTVKAAVRLYHHGA